MLKNKPRTSKNSQVGIRYDLYKYMEQYQVIDTDSLSKYYFRFVEFPKILKLGYNLIRFNLNKELFADDAELYIEFIDSNGGVLPFEVLDFVDYAGMVHISVHVSGEVPNGDYKAYFASTLSRDIHGNRLDTSVANFIWIGEGQINTSEKSDSPLLIKEQPKIQIKELKFPYKTSATTRLTSSYIFGEISIHGGSIPSQFVKSISDNISTPSQYIELEPTLNGNAVVYGGTLDVPSFDLKRHGIIELSQATKWFDDSMINGVVTISNIDLLPFIPKGMELKGSRYYTYSCSIVDVVSGDKLLVYPPLHIPVSYQDSEGNQYTRPVANVTSGSRTFNSGGFSIKVDYFDIYSLVDTDKGQSFAYLKIQDLKPRSGVVDKIVVSYSPYGNAGGEGFQVTQDYVSNNLLIDTSSIYISKRDKNFIGKGSFNGLEHVKDNTRGGIGVFERYWTTFKNPTTKAETILSWSVQRPLLNGIKLRGSDYSWLGHSGFTGSGEYYGFRLRNADKPYLRSDNKYTLYFKCSPEDDGGPYSPQLDIYYSGSVEVDVFDKKDLELSPLEDTRLIYGGSVVGSSGSLLLNNQFDVTALEDGFVGVEFIVRSGNWIVSDIGLYSYSPEGETPGDTYFMIPINSYNQNLELNFNIKYVSSNGRIGNLESNLYGLTFEGSDFFVDGINNVVTSSLLSSFVKVTNDLDEAINYKRKDGNLIDVNLGSSYGSVVNSATTHSYVDISIDDLTSVNKHLFSIGISNSSSLSHDNYVSWSSATWDRIGGRFFTVSGSSVYIPYMGNGSGRDVKVTTTGRLVYLASDERLKDNIVYDLPLDLIPKLLSLRTSKFSFKGETKEQYGLIAQDVEKIFPELVIEDEFGIKTVDYDSVYNLMLLVLQNLDLRIRNLEKMILK